jgi:KDO2-lipid IV(A) lauroyltransferase
MNVRRQLRTALESVLVCAAFALIPWWPRRAIVRAAGAFGRLAFATCRALRGVTLANLRAAYGTAPSDDELRRIGLQSFQTFALVAMDLFWFGVFTRRRVLRHVAFDESMEVSLALRPVVFVTGHLGNWEVVGLAMALQGAPSLSVAARLKSPVGEFVINRVRRRTGQGIIHKLGALRGVVQELKRGGRVAMLMDQNTLPRKGGIFVPFFGLPVAVSDAVSVLCARTGAYLVVAACVPEGTGYKVWAMPPESVGGPSNLRADEVTARLTNHLETLVRRFPGCWAWGYKRWKYIPAGADASRYPFYAQACENNPKKRTTP